MYKISISKYFSAIHGNSSRNTQDITKGVGTSIQNGLTIELKMDGLQPMSSNNYCYSSYNLIVLKLNILVDARSL